MPNNMNICESEVIRDGLMTNEKMKYSISYKEVQYCPTACSRARSVGAR